MNYEHTLMLELLEEIYHLNELINLHPINDSNFMSEQYEARKAELEKELEIRMTKVLLDRGLKLETKQYTLNNTNREYEYALIDESGHCDYYYCNEETNDLDDAIKLLLSDV